MAESEATTVALPNEEAAAAPTTTESAPASTLIEFPGTGRSALPQWRKELSERVREIQQRRAREAALDAEEAERRAREQAEATDAAASAAEASEETPQSRSSQLGLVPPAAAAEMNPIVVAALRRVERARRPPAPPVQPRSAATARAAAATAVARVAEERYEPPAQPSTPTTTGRPAVNAPADADAQEEVADAARVASLSVVPPKSGAKEAARTAVTDEDSAPVASAQAAADATANATPADAAQTTPPAADVDMPEAADEKPKPRRIEGVLDDNWLERREREAATTAAAPTAQAAATAEAFDDRAPLARRFAGAVIDLLVIAFLSSPFAAIIELTIGQWEDPRVWGSMAGIITVVAFMYLMGSTALAGRTWGMSLFSLHTVDARTALAPTAGQSARRAIIYMLSLATFGLGILYALFDAEGRTAHDRLSGTVVVRE